jgi:hypothetical protein
VHLPGKWRTRYEDGAEGWEGQGNFFALTFSVSFSLSLVSLRLPYPSGSPFSERTSHLPEPPSSWRNCRLLRSGRQGRAACRLISSACGSQQRRRLLSIAIDKGIGRLDNLLPMSTPQSQRAQMPTSDTYFEASSSNNSTYRWDTANLGLSLNDAGRRYSIEGGGANGEHGHNTCTEVIKKSDTRGE